MAQQTTAAPTTTTVERLSADLAVAEGLSRQGRLTDARSALEGILQAARAGGFELQQGQALCGLAEVYYENNQNVPARNVGVDALAIFERLGDVHGRGRANHVLGLVADRIGDRAEARERFAQAVAALESEGNLKGRALATLGLLRVGGAAPDDVEALYQRTIADAVAMNDLSLQGRARHSLGDRLFSSGKYEAALEQLEQAASALDRASDRVALGTVYNSLGRLYRAHGRLETALAYQLKALSAHEQATSPFNRLQSLNAVAVTYQAMGDAQQARVYFDRALELAEGSTSARIQDLLRANLASTLIEQGEYARAADVLQGVLNRALDVYPARRYSDLASAYLKLGRREEALGDGHQGDRAVRKAGRTRVSGGARPTRGDLRRAR